MVKVISLSDRAYTQLKEIKGQRSFSEVVIDLVERTDKKQLSDFFGKWSGNDAQEIKMQLARERRKTKTREVRF